MVSTRSQSAGRGVGAGINGVSVKGANARPNGGGGDTFSHSGRGSVLWSELTRRASVTTIEPKFAVSPYVGEFFCCITVSLRL